MLTIQSFKVFDQIYLLTQGGPGTSTLVLVYHIYNEAFVSWDLGYSSTVAFVLFLIVLGVTLVLGTPELRAQWEQELAGMRERIRRMRQTLRDKLERAGLRRDFGFITRQQGMFSYSGLRPEQMQRLRNEFGIYGVDSGRICVAALNDRNIDAVVSAMAKVERG